MSSYKGVIASKFICDTCGREPNYIGGGSKKPGVTCGQMVAKYNRYEWYVDKNGRCTGKIKRKG